MLILGHSTSAIAPPASLQPVGLPQQARDEAGLQAVGKGPRGAISLRKVSVTFARGRHEYAVRDVSLDVAPGEFVALVGPSGCGKTTLLNVIGGMLQPSSGSASIDGQLVREPTPACNVVFQQHSLFAWMTVLDNVAFGPRALGFVAPEEIARRFLKLVGLDDFADAWPATLSGGMQQRVAIARALATQPGVLLMDEPFGALDAQTRSIMQEEVLRLRVGLQPTVIFVTHDIDEALLLADRIVVMSVNPGTLKAVIDVNAQLDVPGRRLQDQAFIGLRQQLLGLIREESLKVFNQ
ncbi:MAG: ABC transporter ATP-binding protein [Rhodocyclaceae bacterium]|nr:ABC transporter ATP-binding protein [Rhodocyclaceae bacterium]